MPYSIKWRGKNVCCTFRGEVSSQELIGCNMSLYGNSKFDEIRLQIFDMLNVTEIAFNKDAIEVVAAYDRAASKVNPWIKCAVVATDQVKHKLAKVYREGTIESPWEAKAFHTLSEALEWGNYA